MIDAAPADRLGLALVDGREFPEDLRRIHRPGEVIRDRNGRPRRLPRFFYEVPSWERAVEVPLTAHFSLYEFVSLDVREPAPVRHWPRYVPCAVALLAAHLELLRQELDQPLFIAANGGYRSPGHALDRGADGEPVASPHHWGTAANVYRIGADLIDTQGEIEKFGAKALALLPGVWVRPFGTERGFADDHLHLDLGYTVAVPHEAADEGADA
jgi:hypothetical protein